MPNGRPPKPVEVKRLNGNPGRRPLPETVIALPMVSEPPKPPRTLGKPGRETWKRLWGAASAWLSPQTDYDLLVRLCEAHDERTELRKIIADQGYVIEGSLGQTMTNPAVRQLRNLEALMTKYESLCGFTPSDRSRLGWAEVKRVSGLEAFLAKRDHRATGTDPN